MVRCYRPFGVAALALLGCTKQTPGPSPWHHPLLPFTHEGLGVSLGVPHSWGHTIEGPAVVFSGPENTPSHYTTLSLQGVTDSGESLISLLFDSFRTASTLPGFAWRYVGPAVVATQPAVRYTAELELHETARLTTGVLIHTGATVVILSYCAPKELFFDEVDTFEEILASISLFLAPPAIEPG